MMALLSWRVWVTVALAVLLAGTHWKAYVQGGKSVQAEWNAERLQLTQAAMAAEVAARAKEADLQTKVRSVSNAYAKEKAAHAVTVAASADGLRSLQSTLDSAAATASTCTSRTDDLARARIVVGQCAKALQELADTADAGEARLSGLQDYVRSVGLDK
jgi:hypothetical protein